MNKDQKIEEIKAQWFNGYSVCAVVNCKLFLEKFPDEFSILIILGNALAALDKFDEATNILERAIELAAQDQKYHALVTMGFVFYERGSFAEAVKWFEDAFNNHDPRPVDLVLYAESLIKLGKYSKAIQELKNIGEAKSKQNETYYYTLGVAYRALGSYDNALSSLQKSVEINSNYEVAIEAAEDILKMKSQRKI